MTIALGRKLIKSSDKAAGDEDIDAEIGAEELELGGADLFAAALATANSFLYVCCAVQ
jgi:hypothetical protein